MSSSWALEIDDLDRLAAVQADARMEHVRTEPGAFRASFRGAEFGSVRMQANHVTNGYLARGTLRPDRYAVMFATGGPSGASRINGWAPEIGDILMMRPGAELLSHARPGQSWAVLLLDRDGFAPLLERGWPAGLDSTLVPGRLRSVPALPRLVAEIGELAATDPDFLSGESVADALTEAVSVAFAAALEGMPDGPGRAAQRQTRMAATAVDYLDAALGRAVYSDEVGRALGVGPRALNEAFAAVFGMSLHRYLRVRRLQLARRRLLTAEAGGLVKTVALDLGFWHLGRFALEYRALFGETPSETLARRGGGAAAM